MSFFHPDPEIKVFNHVDELRDHLKLNRRGHFVVNDFGKLKFSQSTDGKLQLDWGSGVFEFTDTGFTRFCEAIKVPANFVRILPFDNLVKDLLIAFLHVTAKSLTILYKDNLVYGVSKRVEPLSCLEILNSAFMTNHKEFTNVSILNEDMLVQFTNNEFTLMPGDNFKSGLSLVHRGSQGVTPELSFYTLRLICTNGMVGSSLVKLGKFSNRLEKSKLLTLLPDRVDSNLVTANDLLITSCVKMSQSEVPQEEKKFIKGFLAKKLDFNIEDASDGGSNQFDALITNKVCTFYDLLNFITDYAKNFETEDKFEIEALGGRLAAGFRDVDPASELFSGYTEFKRKMLHKDKVPTL